MMNNTTTKPRLTRRERGWLRLCIVLGAAIALQGCAAHAPAPQVEAVGQLSAGPSVWSAPLKHDAPPEVGLVVDTGSDDATDTVSTTTRVEVDAGATDAEAPDVVTKEAHGF